MQVKPQYQGKRVILTRQGEQTQFALGDLNPAQIQQAVSNGVPVSFFTGTKGEMKELERFSQQHLALERGLTGKTRTRVEVKISKKESSRDDRLDKIKAMVDKGLSFDQAVRYESLTLDQLREDENLDALREAYGLKGNSGAPAIYKLIHG